MCAYMENDGAYRTYLFSFTFEREKKYEFIKIADAWKN